MNRIRGRKLQQRNAKLRRRDPLCVVCRAQGRISPATQWDHIVPLFKGGRDHESNLQGLCLDCHRAKTAEDMGHTPRLGCDVNGVPISATHHWHQGGGGCVKLADTPWKPTSASS